METKPTNSLQEEFMSLFRQLTPAEKAKVVTQMACLVKGRKEGKRNGTDNGTV